MSHYDSLNLLTASGLASLDSTASLNNAVSLNGTAPLNSATNCSRLSSFLALLNKLASFALLSDGGNYETE